MDAFRKKKKIVRALFFEEVTSKYVSKHNLLIGRIPLTHNIRRRKKEKSTSPTETNILSALQWTVSNGDKLKS